MPYLYFLYFCNIKQRYHAAKVSKRNKKCNTRNGLFINKIKKIMKKQGLEFSTKYINSNFRIKVYGRDNEGRRINQLMGVSGTLHLIGEELMNKFLRRSLDSMQDVCVCKLRRGLQISFYAK